MRWIWALVGLLVLTAVIAVGSLGVTSRPRSAGKPGRGGLGVVARDGEPTAADRGAETSGAEATGVEVARDGEQTAADGDAETAGAEATGVDEVCRFLASGLYVCSERVVGRRCGITAFDVPRGGLRALIEQEDEDPLARDEVFGGFSIVGSQEVALGDEAVTVALGVFVAELWWSAQGAVIELRAPVVSPCTLRESGGRLQVVGSRIAAGRPGMLLVRCYWG